MEKQYSFTVENKNKEGFDIIETQSVPELDLLLLCDDYYITKIKLKCSLHGQLCRTIKLINHDGINDMLLEYLIRPLVYLEASEREHIVHINNIKIKITRHSGFVIPVMPLSTCAITLTISK